MKRIFYFLFLLCSTLIIISQQFVLPTAQASNSYHPRTSTAASSCVGGCSSGWTHARLIDSNHGTIWSSNVHTNPNSYEWFAFWFDTYRNTDFVKLVPRLVNGQAIHVPERVNIYYSANGNWNFIKTVDLPETIDVPNLGGYAITFNPVNTNGILITSDRLRPDNNGYYYFQMGEAYAGLAQPSQTISYVGFTCDVYGHQIIKVLDNDIENLAYDFNITKLASNSYAAVFHAEAYNKSSGCWGDSVAVRYGNSPDAYLGNRTGSNPGDYIVTRTSNNSHYMYSNLCNQNMNATSGGGNPILIKRGNTQQPPFVLYYLSVSDYNGVQHDDYWRHYLMVSSPMDVNNMLNTTWASVANNGSGDFYQWFTGGSALVWQNYNPSPARQTDGSLLHSNLETYCANDMSCPTQGLIGNMTKDGSTNKIYYFYSDVNGITAGQGIQWDPSSFNGTPVTLRREMQDEVAVNIWTPPVMVKSGAWWNVAYHATLNRWMVLSQCTPGEFDICMGFTTTSNVNSISSVDLSGKTLGLTEFFHDPVQGNGIMAQYGFLKNEYGQIPGNDFRFYVTVRNNPIDGVYGMDMYSVRVNCH